MSKAGGPLDGIRVIDLSQALAGPMSTRLLADLGAQVIKVEPPRTGEASRGMGTTFTKGESHYYMTFNRNKEGLTLDLRSERGRAVFYDLAAISDVVLDNFRPGVTGRLGVDYETVRKVNPTIVCCSVSGFGRDGPYRDRPAFDSVVQALSGAMSVTGEPGGDPAVMGFAVTDIGGGYGAAVGVLSALLARERTGEGQQVDLSLLDILLTFQGHLSEMYLGGGRMPTAGGSVQSANLPNGAFKTSDDKYVQIHCATQKFYEELARQLAVLVEGCQHLVDDDRFITLAGRQQNWPELKSILENAFVTRTQQEWIDLLGDVAPIAPVNNIADAFSDAQVVHRNMLVEAEHPVVGAYKMPGNPIKFVGRSDGPEEFRPAPTLGQHNRDALTELLGYSEDDVKRLEEDGVI